MIIDLLLPPLHFCLGIFSAALFLVGLIFIQKKYYQKREIPLLLKFLRLFSIFYIVIVVAAHGFDVYCDYDLKSYDENTKVIISGTEIAEDYRKSLRRVTNDTARNLAPFTGIIFAVIISVTWIVFDWSLRCIQSLKN